MEREYRTIDKTDWKDGPWKEEPDKVQWKDAATGLACLAVRNPVFGHWCGYVGVPEEHPLFGKQSDELPPLEAHGDVNFAGACGHGPEDQGVCHIPEPGDPEVWWLGFDCLHGGDYAPQLRVGLSLGFEMESCRRWEEYRTLGYVKEICATLAAQLMKPENEEKE